MPRKKQSKILNTSLTHVVHIWPAPRAYLGHVEGTSRCHLAARPTTAKHDALASSPRSRARGDVAPRRFGAAL
eukprot:6207057-Pleurochrysis_carterae.AAC.1